MTHTLVDYDPLWHSSSDHPYKVYAALREQEPVHYCPKRAVWVLSRFSDVQSALRDWRTFSSARGADIDSTGREVFGKGNLLDLDPPRHDQLRDVVRRTFTPRSIEALRADVERTVERLIEAIRKQDRFDLVGDFAGQLTLHTGAGLILGVPQDDLPMVGRLLRATMTRRPGQPGIPAAAAGAGSALRGYLGALLDERRRRPGPDLLSSVAAASIDGEPLNDEAVGLCFLLLVASIDTTSSLISSCLAELARHPEQRRAIATEPELAASAIEETMRFESPVQYTVRTTTRQIEYEHGAIPEHSRVVLLLAAANRDDRRWPAPDEFDIRRDAKRHLGFGEGIHFCLGAPLARLEGTVAIPAFLAQFPDYEIRPPLERMTMFDLRGLARAPLAWSS